MFRELLVCPRFALVFSLPQWTTSMHVQQTCEYHGQWYINVSVTWFSKHALELAKVTLLKGSG
jgi:hypothetical protein